jgi:hypothetical protein
VEKAEILRRSGESRGLRAISGENCALHVVSRIFSLLPQLSFSAARKYFPTRSAKVSKSSLDPFSDLQQTMDFKFVFGTHFCQYRVGSTGIKTDEDLSSRISS